MDDCFIFWDNHYDTKSFIQILNSLDSNLKFNMESDANEIFFLDIKVLRRDDKITTNINYKHTDSHQYLQFKSCHPRHPKITFPTLKQYVFAPSMMILIYETKDSKI